MMIGDYQKNGHYCILVVRGGDGEETEFLIDDLVSKVREICMVCTFIYIETIPIVCIQKRHSICETQEKIVHKGTNRYVYKFCILTYIFILFTMYCRVSGFSECNAVIGC